MLAAFAANFEVELQGKLLGMMRSSLAGPLGPIERRQADPKEEHQQPRREVNRMHESHTKDNLDLRAKLQELMEAVRNLTATPPEAGARSASSASRAASAPGRSRAPSPAAVTTAEEVVRPNPFSFTRPLSAPRTALWPERIGTPTGSSLAIGPLMTPTGTDRLARQQQSGAVFLLECFGEIVGGAPERPSLDYIFLLGVVASPCMVAPNCDIAYFSTISPSCCRSLASAKQFDHTSHAMVCSRQFCRIGAPADLGGILPFRSKCRRCRAPEAVPHLRCDAVTEAAPGTCVRQHLLASM